VELIRVTVTTYLVLLALAVLVGILGMVVLVHTTMAFPDLRVLAVAVAVAALD
jgi:hypothetical protein